MINYVKQYGNRTAERHFGLPTKKILDMSSFKKSTMLVWDQIRVHKTKPTKKLLKELNTELAVIPEGLTSQLQPKFYATRVELLVAKPNYNVTSTGCIK